MGRGTEGGGHGGLVAVGEGQKGGYDGNCVLNVGAWTKLNINSVGKG
jgi:hypothetical protein